MTAAELVNQDIQESPPPSPPRPVLGLGVIGLGCGVVGTLFMAYVAKLLRDYNHDNAASTIIGVILIAATLYAWVPAVRSFGYGSRRSSLLAKDELVASRRVAARGRELALISMGYAATSVVVAAALWFVLANHGGVAETFFQIHPISTAFGDVLSGFWTNVWVAVVAEIIVLIVGLLVAIVRMLPGKAGAPLRYLAVMYTDVFRGIPAIIVISLVGFGLPLTGIDALRKIPLTWLGIIALTLTYTAYVSEVYRAGLTSIHPSQSAAARSLGLSYSQTLRKVLVPQAVRRVVPPLLNDFIGLQKDTALLSTIAIPEALQNAKLYEAQAFNLSPILLAALFFVLITIPQARFVDYLLHRDETRRAGGAR